MSRTVLALMAGLLCTLAGIKHAASLKHDALRLQRWHVILSHLALLIREGSLPIPAALVTCADMTLPPDMLLRRMAENLQSSPLLSLQDAFRLCAGNIPEHDVLQRMFATLGHGSRAQRLLGLEQAIAEIQLLAADASSKAKTDAKLWQTLGLVGGTCLIILLL